MKFLIDPEKLRDALIEASQKIDRKKTEEIMAARGTYITMAVADLLKGALLPDWAERAEKKKGWPAAYTEGFEVFWEAFPSRSGVKSGKAAAYKAWQKMAGSPENETLLLNLCQTALSWQKETDQWKNDNGQYIPMASTYLNQKRYEDEAPVPEQKEESGPMDWDTFG